MEYKKIMQIAVIAVVAVWVFCISFAVSMKVVKKDDDPITTQAPQIQTTTGNEQVAVTSSQPLSSIGGNNISEQFQDTTAQQVVASTANSQQTSTTQGSAPTSTVPTGKSEIIASYVNAVNALKGTSNFSLYKDDKLNITIDSISGGSVVEKFAQNMLASSQKQPITYNFQNGVDSSTGATPMSAIAPLNKSASIDESFVTNATATPNADGGYTIDLSFASESQTYPNETVHHKNVVEVVDVEGLIPSGATINNMNMTYSGTNIKATLDSSGKITYMRHYLNVENCTGSGSMSVFTMNITLHGDFVSEYTITY